MSEAYLEGMKTSLRACIERCPVTSEAYLEGMKTPCFFLLIGPESQSEAYLEGMKTSNGVSIPGLVKRVRSLPRRNENDKLDQC